MVLEQSSLEIANNFKTIKEANINNRKKLRDMEIFNLKKKSQRENYFLKPRSSTRRASLPQNGSKRSKDIFMKNRQNSFISLASSSSSNSFSEQGQQDVVYSSSSSETSDDVELAKYMSDIPTNIFHPVNVAQTENENLFNTGGERSRQYFHRRHQSDSGFVKFF